MKKIIFIVLLSSLTVGSLIAQKAQRIAYIDSEYILENMPEYIEAQAKLNEKIQKWQIQLDAKKREIEMMKAELVNQKALLTKELIQDKDEDIIIKETELRDLQSLYFGPNGDMFFYRKQLVKPIQDQMYNAVKEISEAKKYDFVFDKTSDLIMLYSNNAYDISELVLNSISKTKRKDEMDTKRSTNIKSSVSSNINQTTDNEISEAEKSSINEDKEALRLEREEQQKAIIADKKLKREEQQQKLAAQRQENLRKREEAKLAASKKKTVVTIPVKASEKKENLSVKKDTFPTKVNPVKDTLTVVKDTLTTKERIALERKQKQEAQKKALDDKRLEGIRIREEQKKALEEKRLESIRIREEQKKKNTNNN